MQRFVSQAPCVLRPGQSGVLADGRGFKVVEAAVQEDGRCEFLAVTHSVAAAGAGEVPEAAAQDETLTLVAARPLALPYELPAPFLQIN